MPADLNKVEFCTFLKSCTKGRFIVVGEFESYWYTDPVDGSLMPAAEIPEWVAARLLVESLIESERLTPKEVIQIAARHID